MSSLSTLPKGDSAWLLRKAIERIIQQISVLETNIGSSTTGNSANTQIIFNDNGVLRGDSGLTYNKTTDLLSVGAATITGDLTVDTSTLKVDSANNRVGVLNTPTVPFEVTGLIAASSGVYQAGTSNGIFSALNNDAVNPGLDLRRYTGTATNHGTAYIATSSSGDVLFYTDAQASNTRATTLRMTLNSTGLGVGLVPSSFGRFSVQGTAGGAGILGVDTDATRVDIQSYNKPLALNRAGNNITMCEGGGNVGVGVTPSAWNSSYKALQVGGGAALFNNAAGSNSAWLTSNFFFNSSNANTFIGTGYALMYRQVSGEHAWLTSTASGTAGGAATMTQMMTLDASGRLLIGTATSGTAAGDGIIKLGVRGHVISNNGASIANNSFVDVTVNTSGSGYQGFLSVSCTDESQANNRTQATYSIFGRGASATITQIATANGSGGGASFTVTIPSNGVIRITNTSGVVCTISAQFFGGTSF